MKTRAFLISMALLFAAALLPARARLVAAFLNAKVPAPAHARGANIPPGASQTQSDIVSTGNHGTLYTNTYLPVHLKPAKGVDLVDPGSEFYHGAEGVALNAALPTGKRDDIDGGLGVPDRPDLDADQLLASLSLTKLAAPDPVKAGERLTYTIHVTNTGDVSLHATVTDTLPVHTVPVAAPVGAGIFPGGTLTWTAVISPLGGTWMQTVVVSVELDYAGPLTNTVHVTTLEGATGTYTETSRAYVERHVFLPLAASTVFTPVCTPELLIELPTGPTPYGVALDVAGRRVFVAHGDGLTVFDADTYAVITTTQSASRSHGIAFDPDRDRIWVTHKEANRVAVLDGASYAPLADLPAGTQPHSVAYNPANGRVYVTNYVSNTVTVYNAETLTAVTELTNFAEPSHIAVNNLTNKVYVANHKAENSVTVIDGATHATARIPIALYDPYGIAVDVTRNLIYVTAIAEGKIAIIDGAAEEALGYLRPRRSDGRRVEMRVIAVNPYIWPEGHLLFVNSSEDQGQDQFMLVPNGWPTLGTPVPLDIASYPLDGIALDPYTNRVWVTSVQSGLVTVIRDGVPVCDTPLTQGLPPEITLELELATDAPAAIDER